MAEKNNGVAVSVVPAKQKGEDGLTRFQEEILYTLAADGEEYGLGIKEKLQEYFSEEVNHGRLYPNIDALVERGLVEKEALDKRTNTYRLTSDGLEVAKHHALDRIEAVSDDYSVNFKGE